MTRDSKYFDMIRIKRARSAGDLSERTAQMCEWKGCHLPGHHRAPRGRGREGQYFLFCEDHIRQYNANYNYFDGMSDDDVAAFQKDAITGHRPTWKVGANSWAHGTHQGARTADPASSTASQATNAQSFYAWRAKQARAEPEQNRRQLKPLERKSLDALGLQPGVSKDEIKARFKELVKRHHPDSNGGDRASEDKLREIIQAYNHLKQAGLV
jgi:curved DNA-binding protein CbpA